MSSKKLTFQYANECDMEIHCSPFGLSGLYIKIKGTNIMGLGSTMGLITGSTKGLIHYNDKLDLVDQKYKLYVVVDENDMLRIDFTKISTAQANSLNGNETDGKKDLGNPVTQPDQPTSATGNEHGVSSHLERSTLPDNLFSGTKELSDANSDILPPQMDNDTQEEEEEEVPTLIFKGKCPEGRPDKIEPFIGIFSFERED